MDMSKAFDKVSHRRLKHKLSQFGFGGSLLQWLSSYLTDHLQRVTGLDATSDPFLTYHSRSTPGFHSWSSITPFIC